MSPLYPNPMFRAGEAVGDSIAGPVVMLALIVIFVFAIRDQVRANRRWRERQ